MTQGPVNANDIGIYIGGVLIACLTNAQFQSSNSQIDVICKDYRGTLDGTNTWSLSGSTNIRFDAAYGPIDLLQAHKAKQVVAVKFGTEVTGDSVITGECRISEITFGAGVDSAATCDFTMPGQGEYTISTNA